MIENSPSKEEAVGKSPTNHDMTGGIETCRGFYSSLSCARDGGNGSRARGRSSLSQAEVGGGENGRQREEGPSQRVSLSLSAPRVGDDGLICLLP